MRETVMGIWKRLAILNSQGFTLEMSPLDEG
jgi:hypothetical protein